MDILGYSNPYDELSRMQRRINRIFDEAFSRPGAWGEEWSPLGLGGTSSMGLLGSGSQGTSSVPTGGGAGEAGKAAGAAGGRLGEQQQQLALSKGGAGQLGLWGGRWNPKFNVSETDQQFIISAEVPGVDRNDIHVDLSGDGKLLTVRGEKKEEKKDEGQTYLRTERRYGSFARSFRLPEGVEADRKDAIQAKYDNGVLEVRVHKSEKMQSDRKSIEIQ